jgi:multidrug efflux pump subunit AcrB
METPMRLTRLAIREPVAVAAAALLLVAFGAWALLRLPVQLFPDVERPEMNIETSWRGAAPAEIEAEILEPQESVLQGLAGLEEIEATASPGRSRINLRFAVGTDLDAALVEVLARFNRLPPMPADAGAPAITAGGQDANTTLSWFFVQLAAGASGTPEDHLDFIDEIVRPRLEAVPGVARVETNLAAERDLVITVDLARLADYGIGVPELAARAGAGRDVSAGTRDIGRRQYTLRLAARYDPDELAGRVLAWRDGRPVRLGDVATIAERHPPRSFVSWQNGNPAVGLRVVRADGANVPATLDAVKREVAALREGPLAARGLAIEQSFDPSLFINRAINLLGGNLLLGMVLALGCVWWFLRDLRATALIAVAVPVSLAATAIALALAGRTLNVISLAALAFAVGMVMDAAIVVAENILGRRERGESATSAAWHGTREVAGALLASTLTTIAVFAPVLFLDDVEGRIFADLALTIAIAVAASLAVALTVVPAASVRALAIAGMPVASAPRHAGLARRLMAAVATREQQWGWLGGLVVLPLAAAAWFAPPVDWLPPVKRAAVDAWFSFPPGMSVARIDAEIGGVLRARMAPYMAGEREPRLLNWYFQAWPGGGTLGARVVDPERIGELERLVRDEIIAGLPDTRAFATEGELFGGFGGSARAIAVHLQGRDPAALAAAAIQGRELLQRAFPGANVQAVPAPDAAEPELRVQPDDRRLAEVGWTRDELAVVLRTLGGGAWLGEYSDGDGRRPVLLEASGWTAPEALPDLPLATPEAGVVRLGDLARIDTVNAAQALRRVDGRRTLTLTVAPPTELSLEQALARIEADVLPPLRAALQDGAGVRVAGSADRLEGLLAGMATNALLAVFVLAVLLAAMFRSVVDAAIVLATLPLALLGGVLALRVAGLFVPQQLDLVTMIGFVMLLGMAINNGVLLIAQTRAGEAAGLALAAAVERALALRLRPLAIAALTGVVGALPLAVSPGPGAAIYRGMAAVTVGGVLLNLVFSALLVPALLLLTGRRRHVVAHLENPVALARAA